MVNSAIEIRKPEIMSELDRYPQLTNKQKQELYFRIKISFPASLPDHVEQEVRMLFISQKRINQLGEDKDELS